MRATMLIPLPVMLLASCTPAAPPGPPRPAASTTIACSMSTGGPMFTAEFLPGGVRHPVDTLQVTFTSRPTSEQAEAALRACIESMRSAVRVDYETLVNAWVSDDSPLRLPDGSWSLSYDPKAGTVKTWNEREGVSPETAKREGYTVETTENKMAVPPFTGRLPVNRVVVTLLDEDIGGMTMKTRLGLLVITLMPVSLGAQGWWQPAPLSTWQWQLTGTIDTSVVASIYDVDLFDVPASTVAALHVQGRKIVCYFSAGSWENWRPDARQFPAAVLGRGNGWPGEKWLDIRRLDILGPIMAARMDLCVQKGFDAIEPDNIDGYTNRTGFPLTAAQQRSYNRWLAAQAHARGLGAFLKNDLAQTAQLVGNFDGLIVEECYAYSECGLTNPFQTAGKAILAVEYSGTLTVSRCVNALSRGMSLIKKRFSLDAWRQSCF